MLHTEYKTYRKYVKPLEEIFIKHEKNNRSNFKTVRHRVLSDNLVPYLCAHDDCPTRQLASWRGEALVLELDHIDGDVKNNELTNLRFLCRNCHGQTETYGSKLSKPLNRCDDCNVRLSLRSIKRCEHCLMKSRKSYYFTLLPKTVVEDLLENVSMERILEAYEMHTYGAKRQLNKLGLKQKVRGYWQSKDNYSREQRVEDVLARHGIEMPQYYVDYAALEAEENRLTGGRINDQGIKYLKTKPKDYLIQEAQLDGPP